MDGARGKYEEGERNIYCIGCGGNRARGRPRNRWEWKIKMCRREIEWCGMDKIHMAKNRDKLELL